MEDPHQAQERRIRIEKEAVRRLATQGHLDPRYDFKNLKGTELFDKTREYDAKLFLEIENIKCSILPKTS